nr:peptide-methionine (S)-S-oxide reductase MsrA [Shewanella sp. SNU WT4]
MSEPIELATLGGGCFWCTEAIFLAIKGVKTVASGYSGGEASDADYRQVCTGKTQHAEVVQIEFNPNVISFSELLEVFFVAHDPTTLNRQGNDIGPQYRSVIFFHNDDQKNEAEVKIIEIKQRDKLEIVTEVSPFTQFFDAETYHHNYFEQNSQQGYCKFVIRPKLTKVLQQFSERLK